jgi:hypothetical protein
VKKRVIAAILLLVLLVPMSSVFALEPPNPPFKEPKASGIIGNYRYSLDFTRSRNTGVSLGVIYDFTAVDRRIRIGMASATLDADSPALARSNGEFRTDASSAVIPTQTVLSILSDIHKKMCDHGTSGCVLSEVEIMEPVSFVYTGFRLPLSLLIPPAAVTNYITNDSNADHANQLPELNGSIARSNFGEDNADILKVLAELTGISAYLDIVDAMESASDVSTAAEEYKQAWIKALEEKAAALSDPASISFDDWKLAAQAYVMGIDSVLMPENLPYSDFDEKQEAILSSIYHMPFGEYRDSGVRLSNYHSSIDATAGLETLIPAYLEEFNKVRETHVSATGDLSARMGTFPSRIKYLVAMTQTSALDPVDADVKNFIESTEYAGYLWPELTEFTADSWFDGWFNAEAYTLLLATLSEVDAFRGSMIPVIAPDLNSGALTGSKRMLTYILSIKEGLDYINSPEVWALWRKPYESPDGQPNEDIGEFDTLEKIYNKLVSMSAFDGFDTYDPNAINEPFSKFFSEQSKAFSGDYLTGVALSSMYIPMHTNLYDPLTLKLYEPVVPKPETEMYDFNGKYAFNRKALYIDTNADAAVKLSRTGQMGNIRVATLKDLTFADKDIVLYLDDNFYNVKDLSEMLDKAMNRLDNVDDESSTLGFWGKLWEGVTDVFDTSITELAKTAEETLYCTRLWTHADGDSMAYVLPTDQITSYLNGDDYTYLQGYAATSAVYKAKDLKSTLNEWLRGVHPVFVSSPNLPMMVDADTSERNTIYNYLLLKNLEPNMPIGYTTSLDMTSAIYMDIYGNIVTESGAVIIPAASNATLHRASYSPYNAGLLSTYGDAFRLKYVESEETFNQTMKKFFEVDQTTGYWELKSIQSLDGSFDIAALSTGAQETLVALKEMYEYDLNNKVLYYELVRNNIIEVLRGAPLEDIDKDAEGLNTNRRLSKRGVLAASKLEEFSAALGQKDINTTLALPNLAYVEGLEYIILFVYKIIVLVMLIIWMITIYLDAVGHQLSWRTPVKCMGVLLLVVSLIIIVPAAFETTYYQSNKWMLQKEAGYLQMLNLEKRQAGYEIGVTEIQEPDTSTKLLLKMDDIRFHWYDLFGDIVTSSTFDSLEKIYSEYNESSEIMFSEGTETMNDAVYMPVDTLFATTDILFAPVTGNIIQHATASTESSFYTPYYVFLDALLFQVNTYNLVNKTYAYTTTTQARGKVKTLGLVAPWLNSTEFMDDSTGDILSLQSIYGVLGSAHSEEWFSASSIEAMRRSQWCNMDIKDEEILKRIELISLRAREYVSENRNMIGKVTDETFLKSMALDLAMFHNKVFNTQRADTLEMYQFSNEDLLRMAIAPKDSVMKNSPMSFARFVYESGGTVTVYAVALLLLIVFIGSWLKPLATIAIFIVVFSSIFVYKIILRNKTKGYLGYIATISAICGMNILYSMLLKLSVYLPSTGMTTTVCVVMQIILQVLYLYCLFRVVVMAISDWKNVGFNKHLQLVDNIKASRVERQAETRGPKHRDGWEYYNELTETQEERVKNKRSRREVEEDE